MANPTKISWTGPTEYVDGTPYGEADHAGYELEINGLASVAVPVAWNVANAYQLLLADVAGVRPGTNSVRIATVARNGQRSEYTTPVAFQFASVPKAPTAVTVE